MKPLGFEQGRGADKTGVVFVVMALMNGVLCALLVIGAVLRETPVFWRNEGGYPVLLRLAVLWGFYPGLVLGGVATFLLTLWSVRLAKQSRASGFVGLVIVATEWMCLAATFCVMFANNLENLLRGLPLHFHR